MGTFFLFVYFFALVLAQQQTQQTSLTRVHLLRHLLPAMFPPHFDNLFPAQPPVELASAARRLPFGQFVEQPATLSESWTLLSESWTLLSGHLLASRPPRWLTEKQ